MADLERTLLICPLSAGEAADMRADMTTAADLGADAVEVRLDLLRRRPSDAQLRALLADPPLPIIVTCRPARQGGKFVGLETTRLELLRKAAKFGAGNTVELLVDIEADVPPQDRPHAKLILSHHDFDRCPPDIDDIVTAFAASPASVNKIAFASRGPQDGLRAMDILRQCRRPTIALAMGEAGVLSRILARKFGAFGTFAAIGRGSETAPGQPTIRELKDLYRWDHISRTTKVFGVIGCPIAHSMSPAVHNAAFAARGTDAVYVPLRVETGQDNFNLFMDALLARPWMDWRGLSVTIPHKENALAYVGASLCDDIAVRIGAINTISIAPDGRLRGDNTDYAAAIDALCHAMGIRREALAGRSVAVLGAGGAARAIVAALAYYKADVTVYNRTVSRARQLAKEFACWAADISDAPSMKAEIVINCTSLGMHPNVDASPLETMPPSVKVVFDTVYNPIETRLLSLARATGAVAIAGLEMFVNQACSQFEVWTGRPAPTDVMREVVVQRLTGV